MKLGNLEFHIFRESTIRLDGGATFGHVPKVVWNRIVECDDKNRIIVGCNCLLVQLDGRNILMDAGMGLKWNQDEAALYDLNARSFRESLQPFGLQPKDIDTVLLSHLHIDHAGGLTEWNEQGEPSLVFPNADVYVQKGEWLDAHNPDPRSVPSYKAEDYDPVEAAGKLHLLEGDCEILPGVSCEVTGGHTGWHQVFRFETGDEPLYYLADIFPSAAHIKPHWVMGYDLIPLEVMRARARLFPMLKDSRAVCVLGHAPERAVGRMDEDGGRPLFTPLEGVD